MAGYYPDELINEIIAANDIYDVASMYLPLKRAGGSYKGLCPFHSEKTPSFTISRDKQLFHCFGCGEAGTSLQFIMKIENLDFIESVKFLADRAKISLPEGDSAAQDAANYIKKQKLHKIYVEAAKYYHNMLCNEQGKSARAYLGGRHIDMSIAVKFGIGYAPDGFDSLCNHLKSEGYDEYTIVDAGLGRKSDKNDKLYDFFRDRVMFPIIDIRGNVIAFGGRVMQGTGPKYLNSADSLIFNKSQTLFALHMARHSCRERLILCEGYMDVIALHKSGITNAVAALGTAFTAQHARIISRYTGEALLCYDSDDAGKKATQNAIEMIEAVGVRVRVIELEGAKDPDEYIAQKGADKFRSILEDTKSATMYAVDQLKKRYDMNDTEQRVMLVSGMAGVFAKIKNPIEMEIMVKEAAAQAGISAEAIFAEINRLRYKDGQKRNTGYQREDRSKIIHYGEQQPTSTVNPECMLAAILCDYPKAYKMMKGEIGPDFFEDEACKAFIMKMYHCLENDEKVDHATILASIDAEYAKKMAAVMLRAVPYEDPMRAARQIIDSIKEKRAKKAIKEVNDPYELDKYIKSLSKKQ